MKLLLVAYLVALSSGCAAAWYLQQPMRLDVYPSAQVRLYRSGLRCRIEVTTPTETIQTAPTRCMTFSYARP